MATVEQRLSRLEGAYDHLATKADLEKLKSDLTLRMAMLQLAGMAAVATIMAAVVAALKFLE